MWELMKQSISNILYIIFKLQALKEEGNLKYRAQENPSESMQNHQHLGLRFSNELPGE